jgi:hypothetical protein
MGMKKRIRRTDTSTSTSQVYTPNTPTDYSISYAWTVSGLIAYIHTLCHTLLIYLEHLHRIREEFSMGVMNWVTGRQEEEEMVPLNDLDSEDGEGVAQRRQGDGTIKRRRYRTETKGM